MKHCHLFVGRLAGLLLSLSASLAHAQAPNFSAAQAERGKAAYLRSCALCHGKEVNDGEFAPPLKGARFRDHWVGKNVAELYDYTRRSMPPAAPDSLGATTYVDLIAFLLQQNELPVGSDLPGDAAALKALKFPWALSEQGQMRSGGPSGGLAPGAVLPNWPVPPSAVTKLTPVTDATLANPAPGDWPSWRRSLDGTGFSPLKQINKTNVSSLRVAWSLTLPAGPNEATPLQHDGVVFVFSFGDHLQALDAKTGDELWHYARRLPEGVQPMFKRNIALYGDKVYMPTSDLHIVALDAKTGAVVWDEPVGDRKEGWMISGGPLVARGKVMQGVSGRGPGGAYLQALDAQTGKAAWRFYSIARPGEFGDSWNGLPLAARNGGSIWTAGSYDAQLNLVFFGPAPTYDTGPMARLNPGKGISNDGLFTNATVALNPDTGQRVWHYQHLANDQWDFDWAFERHIVQLPVRGKDTKVVVTGGKEAVFDIVEAANGKYVSSFDLGLQNIITAIDPKTGKKSIDPARLPLDHQKKFVCPHSGGAKNWIPAAYNPETRILYEPMVESCMDMLPLAPGERGPLSTGYGWALQPRPDSDGRYGRLQAIDLTTGKSLWTHRERAPLTSGTLATAGGLVFQGALDRWFTAYDDANGAPLWKIRLNDVPNSAPIAYLVDGKQYLAVVVGHGGFHAVSFAPLVPEITVPAVRSSTIWVFELP